MSSSKRSIKPADSKQALFTITAGNRLAEHKKIEKTNHFGTGRNKPDIESKTTVSECTDIFPCELTGQSNVLTAACGTLAGDLMNEDAKPQMTRAAFSLNILGDTFPITVLANDSNGQAQEICQHPEILHHLTELREQVVKKYSSEQKVDGAVKISEERRTAEIQALAQACLMQVNATVHDKFPESNTSFTVVMPFEAQSGDTVIRKVMTFGVGNDLVYKLSADQKELTPLKTKQRFEMTKTTTPADKEQSVGELIAHTVKLLPSDQTPELKRESDKIVIENVTLPFSESSKKTFSATPVHLQDFAEGDVVIAATDCIELLVQQYNAAIDVADLTWKKIVAGPHKFSSEDLNTLPIFLMETREDNQPQKKSTTQIYQQKDILAAMRALYEETMLLHTGLAYHQLPTPTQVGGHFALVQMPLQADLHWKMKANFNTFLMILCDTDYLASLKPGPKWNPLPDGVDEMRKEVLSPRKLLDNPTQSFTPAMLEEIMTALAAIAERRIGTLLNPKPKDKRDPITTSLYKLTQIKPADWYKERNFWDLYHHWCAWRSAKSLGVCLDFGAKKEERAGVVAKLGKS